jgi:hypothetical protein
MPREIAAERPADRSRIVVDAGAAAAGMCERQPEVCAVGVEAAKLAVDLGHAASSAARNAVEDLAESQS